MALGHNTSIVRDGLVFYYDMGNTQKSWRGKPTTNFISNPTEEMARGEFGQYRNLAPTFDTYGLVPYSLSMDIKVNKPGSVLVYMQNGSSTKYGFVNQTISATTEYQRFYFNNITPAISTPTDTAATLATYTTYGSGVNPTVKNIQLELGEFATPFVNGTRSNTQAITDLTNRSAMTAGNLQYNSDGSFDYLYSNPSYIEVPLSTAFNKLQGSINVWIYPTRYNGGNGIFVNRTDSTPNATDWLWIGPYNETFYFRLGDGTTCCNNDNSFANYSSVVPLNTWTNLCCTWSSGGTSAIYINGSLYQSRAISAIPSTSPSSFGRFGLGHANADDYFNGKMPVAQIYNRQLTALEVNSNFNAMRERYGI